MNDARDPAPAKAGWQLYPFLFAVAPVLSIAAGSQGQFRVAHLLGAMALVLAPTAVIYAVLLLLGGRRRLPQAAFVTAAAVVAFFFLVPASSVLSSVSWKLSRPAALALMGLAATIAVLWWLRRRPGAWHRVGEFLTIAGAVLVVWNAVAIARNVRDARTTVERSALARQLLRPIPVSSPLGSTRRPLPDVYLLVLDEYANASVLREFYDFDNRAFEDSLRAEGFVIPPAMASNYSQTVLSLASLLNASHVATLEGELGAESKDVSLLAYLIEHNRVARFFKRAGYRFVFFPSTWFAPTLTNADADEEHARPRRLDLKRELSRTELRRALWRSSALSLLGGLEGAQVAGDPEHIVGTFDRIGRLTRRKRPLFLFAHVMAPHDPYVLDARCQPRDGVKWATREDMAANRVGYVEQLQCVNRLTLSLVRRIRARSTTPPIIILVSDHGSKSMNPFGVANGLPPAETLRERFGAFGAYHVPACAADDFRRPVTLVNVFRIILAECYGAALPRLPDDLYFSGHLAPYAFHRLTLPTLHAD